MKKPNRLSMASFLEPPTHLPAHLPLSLSYKSTFQSSQDPHIFNSYIHQPFPMSTTMASENQSQFEDMLPIMADKLGGEGLIGELSNGFQLLMDADKGVITFDSLKKNASLLGLQDLTDDDLLGMLKEGDFDGDGALNLMEFCVLMFRLSPDLMEDSQFLLEEALEQELNHYHH